MSYYGQTEAGAGLNRLDNVSERFLVRREKALVNSGCKSHPGTGSLHPVAIGAAAEVTMPSEHFGVEGRFRRLGEHAGRKEQLTRL